jgi:ribosomal protein S18 acetylase RimI-like enzyme
MTITIERGGRALARTAISALSDWAPRHSPATTLHAGDVGWHLRLDDADLDGIVAVARDDSDVVAVAVVEPDGMRATHRPDRSDDGSLAAALGDLAQSLASASPSARAPCAGTEFVCDVPQHSAIRAWLVEAGWDLDPAPWALLYRPLSADDAEVGARLAASVSTEQDIEDRVAVQFNAFTSSTFTVSRWRQMAAGPGYRRDLDLLRRDESGTAVAGATAWTAGPGRVGILEPVGAHRDHAGRGHGSAVTLAAIGALARSGASGVGVQTPLSNTAAVRAYQRCGLRVIDHLHAVRYSLPVS